MDRRQTFLTLAKILLAVLFLTGSLAVIGLWWLFATAECEGFGCIGLGWLIFLLVTAGTASAVTGGILVWLDRKCGARQTPAWIWLLGLVNISPLIWLIFRMLVTK